LIAIDDATEQAWTEPRAFWGWHLAELVRRLTEAKTERFGVDIIEAVDTDKFLDQLGVQRHPGPMLALETALSESNGRAVLGVASGESLQSGPLETLIEAAGGNIGSTGSQVSPDNIVRKILIKDSSQDPPIPALSYAVAGQPKWATPDLWINYPGQSPTTISAQDLAAGRYDPKTLAGARVLIGETHRFNSDLHNTPYQKFAPGVLIEIDALRTLLDGRPLKVYAPWFTGLLGALSALVFSIGALRNRIGPYFLATGSLSAIYLGINFVLFKNADVVLPTVAVVLPAMVLSPFAIFTMRAIEERIWRIEAEKKTESIRTRWGAMVSEPFAEFLEERNLSEPGKAHAFQGAILVLDVVGFSEKTNRLGVEKAVRCVNHLLAAGMESVEDQGGLTWHFTGDGFCAVFGFDPSAGNPLDRAVQASLTILDRVAKLNQARSFDEEPWDVRIGLANGEVELAIVGRPNRYTLSVYGEAINLASRLEQAGKALDAKLVTVPAAGPFMGDLGIPFGQTHCPIRGWDQPVDVLYIPNGLSVAELRKPGHVLEAQS
jgi:class 3 adenylate cyclase/CHASE2 domain-containing sensor protein